MSKLLISSHTLAHDDPTANSNPRLRDFDWNRSTFVEVSNPQLSKFVLEPGVLTTIFDGTKATGIDGTTTFSLQLSPLDPNRYRLTATSGTSPAFRTDRGLTLAGSTVSVTVNANSTITIAITAGVDTFAGVLVGDVAFIPGVLTGDAAGPFNEANVGYWTVLAATSTTLQLARLPGEVFSAFGEVGIVITDDLQLQAFSPTGIQVGDHFDIKAGFSAATFGSYVVLAVNPKWVEFTSTFPLGNQTGVVPGASGIIFYSAAKRFVRVEADQECTLRFDGNTDDTVRLAPWIAADPDAVAEFSKVGPSFSLKVLNKSTVNMNLLVIAAE